MLPDKFDEAAAHVFIWGTGAAAAALVAAAALAAPALPMDGDLGAVIIVTALFVGIAWAALAAILWVPFLAGVALLCLLLDVRRSLRRANGQREKADGRMSKNRRFRRYLYGCASIAAAVTALEVATNPPEPVGDLVGFAIALWTTLVVTLLIPYGVVAAAIAVFNRLRRRGDESGVPRTPERQPDRPGVAPEPVSRALRLQDQPAPVAPVRATVSEAAPTTSVAGRPPSLDQADAPADTSGVASAPPPIPDTADALPDDTNLVVSPAILALADALRPLRAKLRARLAEPPWEEPPILLSDEDELADEMVDALDEFQRAFHGSARALNALGKVMAGEPAEARVQRAVDRVAEQVDALLASHYEVGMWDVPASLTHPRDLLEAAIRHVLTQILDWLDKVLDALADPLAAGKRQRAPVEHGKVMLDCRLDFTTPPELADLDRWLDGRTSHYRRASDHPRTSGRGFGKSVAAAVIGFAIGDWLFGGDE